MQRLYHPNPYTNYDGQVEELINVEAIQASSFATLDEDRRLAEVDNPVANTNDKRGRQTACDNACYQSMNERMRSQRMGSFASFERVGFLLGHVLSLKRKIRQVVTCPHHQ